MHALLSHAEPKKQWFIFTAPAHTAVVELAGFPALPPLADLTFERIRDLVSRTTADVRELIVQVCDVNSCHGPDESILEQFEDEILNSSEGYEIYSNVDEYIQEHLVDETGTGVYRDGYKMYPRAEGRKKIARKSSLTNAWKRQRTLLPWEVSGRQNGSIKKRSCSTIGALKSISVNWRSTDSGICRNVNSYFYFSLLWKEWNDGQRTSTFLLVICREI